MARALGLGFLVGFLIAASPGPIFFLILRRTLARGWHSGLISGLGVATGDAIYAALAAFGVTVVSNFLIGQRRWIGLVGGGALILIGLRTLVGRQTPHPDPPRQRGREMRKDGSPAGVWATMVALTLSNPPTILSFSAVFAGLGLRVGSGWQPAIALVGGGALILIGLRTLVGRQTPHPDPPRQRGREMRKDGSPAGVWATMVALTLSNPPTILSFSAVFAGLGLRVGSGWQPAIALV